jgi:penicillin-binding protein 1B
MWPMLKGLLRPRLLLPLAAVLLLHAGYLYYKVGAGLSRSGWEVPSILYGRPTAVRVGDPVGDRQLPERFRRLGYRKVSGRPDRAGTYAEEAGRIRVHPHTFLFEGREAGGEPVDVEIRDGRVVSLATPAGAPVGILWLEPEEFARILGPNMETRRVVPLVSIPESLRNAVTAAEDSRFYNHRGLDFIGIARAVRENIRRRRFAQGGSTITQQLAKNFFLTSRKSLWRKIREAELALFIELRYTKQEILSSYLNKIYFGQEGSRGIYGVEEAARFYFSKGVSELSLEESALLAGILQSPNRNSPLRHPETARERRNWVLSRMLLLDMIDETVYLKAVQAPVRTNPRRSPPNVAGYFVDYIQQVSEDITGGEKLYRTGYRFYTTLDPVLQTAAEEAVAGGLAEIDRRNLPEEEPLQAALVAVDPRTGELVAMVGGRNYGQTQFNRASDAKRQPGSAFKPFILLAAMEQAVRGHGKTTLGSFVSGEPVSITTPEGEWTPANNEGKEYGTITVRRMIEESVNTAAVRLAMKVGLDDVLEAARRAGIGSPLAPLPSAALGSFEVTPLELAYAYATLASGGTRIRPYALRSVVDTGGELLFAARPVREYTVDPRAAFLVTYALEGVFARGTAHSARAAGIDFPAAGKTGTTDGYRDSWFAGYTPDMVCVVWVGRDSGKATGLTGAAGALKIWTRFMKAAYGSAGPPPFEPPPGLVAVRIDPETGYRATTACPRTLSEMFLRELVPDERCPLHPVNPVVDAIGRGVLGVRDLLRDLFN